MELPINIVVMLVVGMVALAALLAIIPESKKNLVVDVISVNGEDGVSDNIDNDWINSGGFLALKESKE